MIIDPYLHDQIGQELLAKAKAKQEEHVPSGKLSASILSWPLQWQMLKYKGVEQTAFDEYTLRKFLRGEQIEQWLVSQMKDKTEEQKEVHYKGAIGYIDVMVDTKNYTFKNGIMPHEVKSVTNAKFKRILSQNGADEGHKLQGGFYALGLGVDHFAVDYVATDDLRVQTYIYNVSEVKNQIDSIINEFNEQVKKDIVPVFEPRYRWQADSKYSSYPSWMDLTQEQINMRLKEL